MAAPEGNQYWKLGYDEYFGKPKAIDSPQSLWELAIGYFTWCSENPWYKKEAIKSGDNAGQILEIPTERPFTLKGLATHIGITERGLRS